MRCNIPEMMPAQTTQSDKALELVKETCVPRPRDLDPHGIPRIYLSRPYTAGKLQRVGRGFYVLPGGNIKEHHALAKTIADCFKYRNKINLDVAIATLGECWQTRRCTMDELWHYADICRVRNVMRPYLETIAA